MRGLLPLPPKREQKTRSSGLPPAPKSTVPGLRTLCAAVPTGAAGMGHIPGLLAPWLLLWQLATGN